MSAQPKVDDIADIMDEIAALQRGIGDAVPATEVPAEFSEVAQASSPAAAAPAVAQAAADVLDEFRAEEGTPPMDETAPEPASTADIAGFDDDQPKIEPISPGIAAAEGCLTMSLEGSMKLKINYDFDGQSVAISFSDGCLKVELENGTEFKIPVGESKRAA